MMRTQARLRFICYANDVTAASKLNWLNSAVPAVNFEMLDEAMDERRKGVESQLAGSGKPWRLLCFPSGDKIESGIAHLTLLLNNQHRGVAIFV